MAEDDDDEAFGDFSFAPFQSNSLFNAPNSTSAAADVDEDDEWGDFVQPPSQSKPPETAVNGDHRSDNSVSPSTWVMPRGALPLSLFGDAEEEEEEAVAGDLVVASDLNQQRSNGIAVGVGSGFAGNGVRVSNQISFSIADLYDNYSQIKHESRAGSELAVKDASVNNGVYSSANQNGAESAAPELKNVNLSNALVVSDHNQLTIKSDHDEFSFKSYMSNPSKEDDLFGGWKEDFNGFSSALSPSPENVLMLSFGLDTNGQKKQIDGSNNAIDDGGGGDEDDEEWDFKDADMEFQAQDVNNDVGLVVQEVSESSPYSSGNGIGLIKPLDLFGSSNGSIDFFQRSTEPVDLFANSSSIPITSRRMDLIGIPNLATLNGLTSDEHSIIEQNKVRGLLGYTTDVGIDELDEEFGDFSAASAKTELEPKELFTNNVLSPNEDAIQTPDVKIQEKDANLNHNKGAIPLSIFGYEEPERDSSSDVQDFFLHQSVPAKRSDHIASSVNSINDMISDLYSQADKTSSTNTKHNLTESHLNSFSAVSSSVLVDGGVGGDDDDEWDFKDASEMRFDSNANSINDMIENLYSQAEQTSVNMEHNLTESELNQSSVVSSSDLVTGGNGGGGGDDDDDDDSSWDFKDASEMRFDSEASLTSTVDPYRSESSKLKLENYLDFYSKLKEELCFVVKNHIDRLKNAQGDADLSGEGARAASFDSEFKLFCNESEHMNFLFEEGALQDHHTRDGHIHEFTQILLEPQFQRLESEYNLSQKLLIVERDPGSSMELMRHTHTMLKILNIGTKEEQKFYVSLWSEMMSVCTQELRHGALIWNDAVVKQVQSHFLSERQGREFILALGEIYRVVVVIGASATLFKPWSLSSTGDLPSLHNLLEECQALWSTSGLEEALSSVLAPTTFDDSSRFKSIKHILSLDVLKLEKYVFAEKEARCRLSLLTAGVVPDLKIVKWGNEQCFVTLANLWANLISCDPPKFPQLNLG